MNHIIYQVSNTPIDIDDYSDPDVLVENTPVVDWVGVIPELEDRCQCIRYLVNRILPKGMFALENSHVIVYLGGMKEWYKRYAEAIHTEAAKIDADSLFRTHGSAVNVLTSILENPLGVDDMFVIENSGYAEHSDALMAYVSRLAPGDMLYIGTVRQFHY